MTFDDVMALKTIGITSVSPDGKSVLYTVSYADMKENERRTEIWLAEAGRKARRFTTGKEDNTPQWSPDGQWIGFLSTRGAPAPSGAGGPAAGPGSGPKAQVYLISPFGGEGWALTDAKGGVTAFAWAPDSKQVAYVALVPLTDDEEKKQKDKDDPQVADSAFRFSHLWVIDVESKTASEIVKSEGVISDPQWSPDGREIAYTTNPTPKADDGSVSDVMIAMADGSGSPRKLNQNDGPDFGARWSPDGKSIAFNTRAGTPVAVGFARLNVIAAGGGTPRIVAPAFDSPVSNVSWSPDGATLYFLAATRTTSQLFSVAASGGEARPVSAGDGTINGASFSRDGKSVAFSRGDLQHPADVYLSTLASFAPVKLSDQNPQIDSLSLGRGEVVRWKGKDGMEIEGVVIYPVGYSPGRRYPVIANIHGGPSGVWNQSFPGTWGNYAHVWAAGGWITFLPNIRGSSAYGEKFQQANIRDWGGGDYQDIQAGLDDLVKRGIADPAKMGQTGWSYGGYMTAWTLTQTDRFKAVMVGAGLTNMYSMYSTNDLQRVLEGYFGGEPWDDGQAYSRASAMTFIKQAKTPTLILHGGNDQRVPIGQAQELYMGLKKNEVPARMVFYPREGHGLNEPRHQLDKMKREYSWFAKYVLGVESKEKLTQ